jgi:hypothetical protein
MECSHRGGAAITPKAQRFTHRIIPSENDTPLCSRVFILPSWLDLQLAQNAKILFSGPYGLLTHESASQPPQYRGVGETGEPAALRQTLLTNLSTFPRL